MTKLDLGRCHPELGAGSGVHQMNLYFVYILINKANKVLYIGVTNDLERRVFEHKNKIIKRLYEEI